MNLKKIITLFLTTSLLLCITPASYAKPTDDPTKFDYIMMDNNNMLKHDFWFLPTITDHKTMEAYFKLPGFSGEPIICVINTKKCDSSEILRTNLTYLEDKKQYYLPTFNLEEGNYEVLLYSGDVKNENFIAKSECVNTDYAKRFSIGTLYSEPVFDSNDNFIDDGQAIITAAVNIKRQASIAISNNLIPRGVYCIKVVTFVRYPERNNDPIDININTFEMIAQNYNNQFFPGVTGSYAVFCSTMNWPRCDDTSTGNYNTVYEHHFYANEVKEENFLFKSYWI